jgi:hypothetical protein
VNTTKEIWNQTMHPTLKRAYNEKRLNDPVLFQRAAFLEGRDARERAFNEEWNRKRRSEWPSLLSLIGMLALIADSTEVHQ